ncbi:MAG TPA: hypothetical protein VFZ38_02995 [Vicinamibacterales bacterium]|jgi:hypothetical protein
MKSIIVAVGLALVSPPHPSEQSWAIRQTVADIQEMAGKPVAESDLSGLTPWTADEKMVAFAATQLGNARGPAEDTPPDQYPSLVHATAAQLSAASDDVSKALKRNMRNPRAHEAAAIVLGAFGLQEAADEFSDHRWVMNRMTAHLAVAAALRGRGTPMGVDGQLAAAVLATLANRQVAALETIARIGDAQAASPKGAWQRALTLRINQDWRVLTSPATASRLEKLEYFRARRATLPNRRAGQELQELKETATADFSRILQSSTTSVEDGNQFVANSIVRELSEFATVYQRAFKRPMPAPLPGAINERAGRLMVSGEPKVLSWGAWAEFSQRHLAMAIADTDEHYRRALDLPDEADSLNEAMDSVLREMRMFSVASSRRVGSEGTEVDLTYFLEALDVLAAAPELIPLNYWIFFETAAAHEGMAGRVPNYRSWFSAPAAEGSRQRRH